MLARELFVALGVMVVSLLCTHTCTCTCKHSVRYLLYMPGIFKGIFLVFFSLFCFSGTCTCSFQCVITFSALFCSQIFTCVDWHCKKPNSSSAYTCTFMYVGRHRSCLILHVHVCTSHMYTIPNLSTAFACWCHAEQCVDLLLQ